VSRAACVPFGSGGTCDFFGWPGLRVFLSVQWGLVIFSVLGVEVRCGAEILISRFKRISGCADRQHPRAAT
jgi:hypothetical protein